MDDAEQLMPAYLRFVKGVIDSTDLPLNVSREILQESRDVKVIREGSTKRVLGMLEELANAENRKEGQVHHLLERVRPGAQGRHRRGRGQQGPHRQAAALRLDRRTSRRPQTVSLADYVGRMKEGQDKIYYVTADSSTPRATARTWRSSARRASKCCC